MSALLRCATAMAPTYGAATSLMSDLFTAIEAALAANRRNVAISISVPWVANETSAASALVRMPVPLRTADSEAHRQFIRNAMRTIAMAQHSGKRADVWVVFEEPSSVPGCTALVQFAHLQFAEFFNAYGCVRGYHGGERKP